MEQDEGGARAVATLLAESAAAAGSLSNGAVVKGSNGAVVKGSKPFLLHLLLLIGNLAIDANGVWVGVGLGVCVFVCVLVCVDVCVCVCVCGCNGVVLPQCVPNVFLMCSQVMV